VPTKIKIEEILGELEKQKACRLDELLQQKRFPLEPTREIEVPGSEIEGVIEIVKQFSETSKLRILLLLYYNGPLPVCIISSVLGLEQTLVSHHLKTFKSLGLVEYERRGKYKLYKLTNCAANLVKALLETLVEQQLKCERKTPGERETDSVGNTQ